jgi:hypothetical protein
METAMPALVRSAAALRWPGSARGRAVASIVAAVIAGVIGAALYLFQPWALFTTTTVHDSLPTGAAASSPRASSAGSVATPVTAALPVTAPSSFRSFEHQTSGMAQILQLADGSTILRLTDLSTSNGPDVRVWLSSKTAEAAADAGNGRWLELGGLKGNRGDQNYSIPAGTDLSGYPSVVLWCRRFSVAFGAAPLVAG